MKDYRLCLCQIRNQRKLNMTQSWRPWQFVIKMQRWHSFFCYVPSCPKTENWGRNVGLLMLRNHRWINQIHPHQTDGPLKSRLTYQKQMWLPYLEIQIMNASPAPALPSPLQIEGKANTHIRNTCHIVWMCCNCNIDHGHGYTWLPIWSRMFNVHMSPSSTNNNTKE